MPTNVSPHGFKPIRFWDLLHKNGRCNRCKLPRFAHPIHYWAPARPMYDKSKAELNWENLHGL